MTYPQIGNEVNHLGTTEMEEVHAPHNWRCCYKRTIKEAALISLILLIGLPLIVRLASIISGQIDSSLQ